MIISSLISNQNDIFEVRFAHHLSDSDVSLLANLYLPIIGSDAFSLYFALKGIGEDKALSPILPIDSLLMRLDISTSRLEEAIHKLEGINLLETYVRDNDSDRKEIAFYLKSPLLPIDFFHDDLLSGLLLKALGEREVNRLRLFYKNEDLPRDMKKVSKDFIEVYVGDINNFDPKNCKILNSKKRSVRKLDITFDKTTFMNKVKELLPNIKDSFVSDERFDEIARLSTLFGVDEVSSAEIIVNDIDLDSGEVDLAKFSKDLKWQVGHIPSSVRKKNRTYINYFSNNPLGEKVKLMEETPPSQFLRILQNDRPPVQADLNLIDDLSKNLHLAPSVINVLIDYCLTKNKNVLSRSYVEKIAASLVRENIKNAVETMNYLYDYDKKSRKKKNVENKQIDMDKNEDTTSTIENENAKQIETSLTDEEKRQRILDIIRGKK